MIKTSICSSSCCNILHGSSEDTADEDVVDVGSVYNSLVKPVLPGGFSRVEICCLLQKGVEGTMV